MSQVDIVIAIHNLDLASRIRQVLVTEGYNVLDTCSSGNDAIRRVRSLRPELLIVNFVLPDTSGFEVAKIVTDDHLCAAVLLTNQTECELVEGTYNDSSIVCLAKPFNKSTLLQTIDLLIKSNRQIKKLQAQLNDMKRNMETRKIVDRAKGLMMEKMGLSEPDAYRKIQKQSMDTGIAMKEVARIIIETME